jgi:TonB family protein
MSERNILSIALSSDRFAIRRWAVSAISLVLVIASTMASASPSDAQAGADAFHASRQEAQRYCGVAPSATIQEMRDFYAKNSADHARYGDQAAPADANRVEVAILKNPSVRYPRSLAGGGLTGKVMMMVAISTNGKAVDSVVVCSNHPDFSAAAREGLRAAKFSPQKSDGVAVGAVAFLPFTFSEI